MRPPSGSGERHARREGLGRDRSTLGCRSAAWLPVFQSSFRSPGKCAEDEEDGDDGEESVQISTINVTSTAMPVQDSTSLDRMRIAERIVTRICPSIARKRQGPRASSIQFDIGAARQSSRILNSWAAP